MIAARKQLLECPALSSNEKLNVGIDIGKKKHVAGFVSPTLLDHYQDVRSCPTISFAQSRQGFQQLLTRIEHYVPLKNCTILLEYTGHYHKALEQFCLEHNIALYIIHPQQRPRDASKTDSLDALRLGNHLHNVLDKGLQVMDKRQQIQRAIQPNDTIVHLQALTRHRYELVQECTRRKQKL